MCVCARVSFRQAGEFGQDVNPNCLRPWLPSGLEIWLPGHGRGPTGLRGSVSGPENILFCQGGSRRCGNAELGLLVEPGAQAGAFAERSGLADLGS